MSAVPDYVEIHIHCVDGYVAAFRQSNPEGVRRLLEHIQPSRIFSQRHVAVASHHSQALFPCASIVRVDLVMDEFPDWEFHHGISDIQEITEEEFRHRYHPQTMGTDRRLAAGAPVVGFAEIELADGERIIVEVHTHVEPRLPVEQSMFFQQILSAPSIYTRRLGGGAILINPASIVRLTLHPGPPTAPANALPAEPLTL